MNTRNIEKPSGEHRCIHKVRRLSIQKILAKLKKKYEDICDLKLEILSLRDQVKGGNNSHTCPTHNVVFKVKIDLPRFDGKNNRDGIR